MRFHVVALPHTQTTTAYSACAFTQKVIGFCRMMVERGHEVVLYAGAENEASAAEHVVCIDEATRAAHVGTKHYTEAPWEPSSAAWAVFLANAIEGIRARAGRRDFICLIGGYAQKAVSDALPNHLSVEIGVGYGGCFLPYKVFESYAWMHTIYGARSLNNPVGVDGTWFDAVIPGYLDPAAFPWRGDRSGGSDYFLFVGRLIERKGYRIAQEVCERLGKRLVLAGPGIAEGYGEFVGVVGPEERGRLMAGAAALFAPTIYIEPFGNVAIEAMACGTPVIATDWGAFTETVIDAVTGFRCRHMADFIAAAKAAPWLDPQAIRRHVVEHYSLDVIGAKYEAYFQRLATLWGAGWYEVQADTRDETAIRKASS